MNLITNFSLEELKDLSEACRLASIHCSDEAKSKKYELLGKLTDMLASMKYHLKDNQTTT